LKQSVVEAALSKMTVFPSVSKWAASPVQLIYYPKTVTVPSTEAADPVVGVTLISIVAMEIFPVYSPVGIAFKKLKVFLVNFPETPSMVTVKLSEAAS
jgi:hypothetical protein